MKMLEEDQNQPQNAQKRTEQITEKGKEDLISALPDCMILEILSRLPSAKEAIRTSTLSKRWLDLWPWLPTLKFSFRDLPRYEAFENPSPYTWLVDDTLYQCRQSKLKRFEVHAHYETRFESLFNSWIHFAISCNVEELHLDFCHTRREAEFRLDPSLFINSHLTHLALVGCMLNPIGPISWKNLKSLCISYMSLDKDFILNILSGSPLLETLVLQSSNIIYSYYQAEANIINIDALNSLSLTQCPELNLKRFEVSTSFDIRFESYLNSWIRYAIRCNVKEFILKFLDTDSKHEFTLDQIVFTSPSFTNLKLKGCMINPAGLISWKNLRSLSISSGSLDVELIDIILYGSPVLESLELDECYGYKRLDITYKSVKKLVISGYKNPRDRNHSKIIEINAPNILSLTIQGTLTLGKFFLVNVSSLVKARFNFRCTKLDDRRNTPKETEDEILKEYITRLGHVKELQIGFLCSEALSRLQAQGFVFQRM